MLRAEGITVRFGDFVALEGVDLDVVAGETVAVLGPSGCGKTTLLRTVAGLERPVAGRVLWDGEDLTAMPPHRRRFSLMFQDYALFPHRDVHGNVEFGLRMAGLPPAEREGRVKEVLALVGLEGFERRRVARLSGGEQQRVALARALAPRPRLLMLDEPFGALDQPLRERLMGDLRGLLALAGLPAVYVTHDHGEAFALAGRVVVMREGRVVQTGAPADLWARPADEWTASFLGFGPAVDARVDGDGAATPWGRIPVLAGTPPGPVRLVLRPGSLFVRPEGAIEGRVAHATFEGERVALRVAVDGAPLLEVRAPVRGAPHAGDPVRVAVDPAGVLLYPPR